MNLFSRSIFSGPLITFSISFPRFDVQYKIQQESEVWLRVKMMRLRAKTANEELSEVAEVLRCHLPHLTVTNDQKYINNLS